MPSSAMGMTYGKPANGAGVLDLLRSTEPGEIDRAEQALAEIISGTPGLKVCLVDRFAPGEMMLWVGRGIWDKLADASRSKTDSAEAGGGC